MNNLQTYNSASIIPISNYGKNQYVLLGLTQNGKLSSFGGLPESYEKNPKDTAARELVEETLGVLGSQSTIRNTLRGLEHVSGSKSGHLTYVIPGIYYGDNIPQKFKQIRFDKNNKLSHSQKEMVDIVAVRVDLIRQMASNGKTLQFNDNDGILRSLRKATNDAIITAVKKGQL